MFYVICGVLALLVVYLFSGGMKKKSFRSHVVPNRSVSDTVAAVAAKKKDWAALDDAAKLKLVEEMRERAFSLIEEYAAAEGRVRGIDTKNPAIKEISSEQYQIGPAFLGLTLNALIGVQSSLAKTGSPPPPVKVKSIKDFTVATVFPMNLMQKVAGGGLRQDVYVKGPVEQGKTRTSGAVCAVLGAGNFSVPCDLFTKLFVENKVCVYKPHPNQKESQDVILNIITPLLDGGWVGVVPDDTTTALTEHPEVDELLMTGGCGTYNAIMWGGPQRKTPKIKIPFDAELGGVGPVIVVPGEWTDAEIDHHAQAIAAYKGVNSGFICASPQVIVTADDWKQTEQLVDRVKHYLCKLPPHTAYYRGAGDRHAKFTSAYQQAQVCKTTSGQSAPTVSLAPVLVPDVANDDQFILREEAFTPVISTTRIPGGGSAAAFLKNAAEYCSSDKVFGSLCSTVLIDPRTQKANGAAFDNFLADLEYGTIGVNVWGGFENFYPMGSWGAYPKHSPEDVQSGVGLILNFGMYSNIYKTVIHTDFVSPSHGTVPTKVAGNMYLPYWATDQTWGRLVRLLVAMLAGV